MDKATGGQFSLIWPRIRYFIKVKQFFYKLVLLNFCCYTKSNLKYKNELNNLIHNSYKFDFERKETIVKKSFATNLSKSLIYENQNPQS